MKRTPVTRSRVVARPVVHARRATSMMRSAGALVSSPNGRGGVAGIAGAGCSGPATNRLSNPSPGSGTVC